MRRVHRRYLLVLVVTDKMCLCDKDDATLVADIVVSEKEKRERHAAELQGWMYISNID
jgi:hypothetical protein